MIIIESISTINFLNLAFLAIFTGQFPQ